MARKTRVLHKIRKVSPARINQRTLHNPMNAPWSENNPIRSNPVRKAPSGFQKRMDEKAGAYNFAKNSPLERFRSSGG